MKKSFVQVCHFKNFYCSNCNVKVNTNIHSSYIASPFHSKRYPSRDALNIQVYAELGITRYFCNALHNNYYFHVEKVI